MEQQLRRRTGSRARSAAGFALLPRAARAAALALPAVSWTTGSLAAGTVPQDVQFWRDVRPVFEQHCFPCHGADERERKAGLRVDVPDELFGEPGSFAYLVRGSPDQSYLLERVRAPGEDRMPPPEHGPALTAAEIDVLVRWVQAGAEWPAEPPPETIAPASTHSAATGATTAAFPPPMSPDRWSRPEPPHLESLLARTPVDAFLGHALGDLGLGFAPMESAPRLLRRVHLDLLARVPPRSLEDAVRERGATAEAVDAWLEEFVASEAFRDRLAQWWLSVLGESAETSPNSASLLALRDAVRGAFRRSTSFADLAHSMLDEDGALAASCRAALAPHEHGVEAIRAWEARFVAQTFFSSPPEVVQESGWFPDRSLGPDGVRRMLDDRPVVARSVANRLFELLFGRELAETEQERGLAGARPLHPELLDWLASELRDSGWDLTHLFLVLARSHSYRQSSTASAEARLADPEALAFSRAIDRPLDVVERLDLRRELANPDHFVRCLDAGPGDGVALEALLHRSVPDFPGDEFAEVAFAEDDDAVTPAPTARDFATALLSSTPGGTVSRLIEAFRRCASREPSDEELLTLTRLFQRLFTELIDDAEASERVLGPTAGEAPSRVDRGEWAAWTELCRLLLEADVTLHHG